MFINILKILNGQKPLICLSARGSAQSLPSASPIGGWWQHPMLDIEALENLRAFNREA